MKRILCQRVSVPSLCKPARDGKETGEDELSQSTNTPKWSQAFEIFRTQHEDLSDEERAVLWKKTRNAMIQEDEVQMRLYAELDLIYGSDDDDDDDGDGDATNDDVNCKHIKRDSEKHKDLVHERVRVALANELRRKAIEADSVDPFAMVLSASDMDLAKVGLRKRQE
jgi:hypothetical protein